MGPLKSDLDLKRSQQLPRRRHQQSRQPSAFMNFVANFNPTRCGLLMMLGVLIVLSLEFVLMHLDVVHRPHYVGRLATQDGGRPWEPGGGRGGQEISLQNRPPEYPGNNLPEPQGQSRQDRVVDPLSGATVDGDKIGGGTPNELVPGNAGILQQPDDGDGGGGALSGPSRPAEEGLGDNLQATLGPLGTEERNGGYGDMRIAVLVPYSGPGLPVWFDAFTDLAAANSNLMDWIIFCEKELAQVKTPDNVKMIPTSPRELAWLLAGVVYPPNADDNPELYIEDMEVAMQAQLTATQERYVSGRLLATRFIQKLLTKNPYYMVEFKPALGWIFRHYLKKYSHWAYGDLDVFFGDLTKGWLEPEEMRDYDIVTYSFGDQHRAYLRGQLTVHKSIPKVNDVWRHCHHLSDYLYRIDRTRVTKRYTLESAEGCYSAALMFSSDIKAKYAVRVFTDMPGGGFQGNEIDVVITGDALIKKCPSVKNRIGEEGGPLASMPQMQVDVGKFVLVQPAVEGTHCEYWINDRFQTCLDLVLDKESSNVYLINGQYYQRGFTNLWKGVVEEGCGMGAFHHFQDFKANFRPWNTRPPMPPTHMGMVARESGLVPLPNGDWKAMAVDPNTPPPWNRDRFTHRYCMEWSVDVDKEKNAYSCLVSVTATDALRPMYDSRTDEAKRLGGVDAVTLGGVGSVKHLDGLLHSMREWTGPKIIVLIMSVDDTKSVWTKLHKEEKAADSCGMENALVMAFLVPKDDENMQGSSQQPLGLEMPIKSLLNALNDLCQTRHLLTLSPGFRIGRGTEKVVNDAVRTPSLKPRVLVIPQWCIDGSPDPWVVPSLDVQDAKTLAMEGTAGLCQARATDQKGAPDNSWLGSSANDAVENGETNGAVLRNGRSLLRSDVVSPILVVDLWSAPALFLRYVEEFTRPRCFDGAYARGLWSAGFAFEMLPGALAFAVRSEVPSKSLGCRSGALLPARSYTLFLKSIREVYSNTRSRNNITMDQLRLMDHRLGFATGPSEAGEPDTVSKKQKRQVYKKGFRSRDGIPEEQQKVAQALAEQRRRPPGVESMLAERRGREPKGKLKQKPPDTEAVEG